MLNAAIVGRFAASLEDAIRRTHRQDHRDSWLCRNRPSRCRRACAFGMKVYTVRRSRRSVEEVALLSGPESIDGSSNGPITC